MTYTTAGHNAALLAYWENDAPLPLLAEKIDQLLGSMPLLNVRRRSFDGPGARRDELDIEIDITLTLVGKLMAVREVRAARAEGRSLNLVPPNRLQRLGIALQMPGEAKPADDLGSDAAC